MSEKIKAHCNSCQRDTNHDVLHFKEIASEYDEVDWYSYQMIQCCGCNSVRMKQEVYIPILDDKPIVTYYPPAAARHAPKWMSDLDYSHVVRELLQEIYVAIHNSSLRLATMGTRSLLEHMMIEKVGDHKSFAKNLEAFVNAGFVSRNHADFLAVTLDAGHATIHRAWNPSEKDLHTLLDVIEPVVLSVYVSPSKIDTLQKKIPPRS